MPNARKFIVDPDQFPEDFLDEGRSLSTFDLSREPHIFVSIVGHRNLTEASISVEGDRMFSYAIPVQDALDMLPKGEGFLKKTSYVRIVFMHVWRFFKLGAPLNFWLATAEPSDGAGELELPPWAIREVTEDYRYEDSWLRENGIPTPVPFADLKALILWRDSLALDWSGRELVDYVTQRLQEEDPHDVDRVPEEVREALKAYQRMGDAEQWEAVARILKAETGNDYEDEYGE